MKLKFFVIALFSVFVLSACSQQGGNDANNAPAQKVECTKSCDKATPCDKSECNKPCDKASCDKAEGCKKDCGKAECKKGACDKASCTDGCKKDCDKASCDKAEDCKKDACGKAGECKNACPKENK